MSKSNQPFRFKRFEVYHHRSSMKIGVDAVILGAWANVLNARTILDVGCGCGVIALMAAQRNLSSRIEAIDIDKASVEEAAGNFLVSPWSERIVAKQIDFNDYCSRHIEQSIQPIDYIISNPPYFDSGVDTQDSIRLKARHQGLLSPAIILEKGSKLISDNGIIGMVIPVEQAEELTGIANSLGLFTIRKMIMTGREGREAKRCFIEFGRHAVPFSTEHLTIEFHDGSFTPEYMSLCRNFYLKF